LQQFLKKSASGAAPAQVVAAGLRGGRDIAVHDTIAAPDLGFGGE